MSSFSDLSQISDISSMLRSSRSSSRLTGRIDSLHNLLESQSTTQNENRSTGYDKGINCVDKIWKSFASCEESINEYVKLNMVLECVKELSMNNKKTLSDDTVGKLKELLWVHETNKYMHLTSSSKNIQEELYVLGITDVSKFEMSCEEKLDIKCYTEAMLREKIHEFILKYENSGGVMKDILKSNECNIRNKLFESSEISHIMNWREKIDEFSTQYKADLLKCKSLINKWQELKHGDVNEMYLKKAQYLLLQANVAEVQAKITKLSCIIRLFKETPITIDAFKALNAAIDEKLFKLIDEIRKKESLKKQYHDLKDTGYDAILKNYLQISNAIKKKKYILQML